jgi:hypothetical protein
MQCVDVFYITFKFWNNVYSSTYLCPGAWDEGGLNSRLPMEVGLLKCLYWFLKVRTKKTNGTCRGCNSSILSVSCEWQMYWSWILESELLKTHDDKNDSPLFYDLYSRFHFLSHTFANGIWFSWLDGTLGIGKRTLGCGPYQIKSHT